MPKRLTQPDMILAWCLHMMETKGWTIEDCLAHFPEEAATLGPLLHLRDGLAEVGQQVRPTQAFKRVAGLRLQDRLRASSRRPVEQQPQQPPRPTPKKAPRWRLPRWVMFPAKVLGITLLILLIGMPTAAYASDGSKPGDLLYGIDLLFEQVQLALAEPDEVMELRFAFAEERLDEAEELAQEGDVEQVTAALSYYEELAITIGDNIDGDAQEETLAEWNAHFTQHQSRLETLSNTLPEQAQDGLTRAMEASQQGQDRAKGKADDDDSGPGKSDDAPGQNKSDDSDDDQADEGKGKSDDAPGQNKYTDPNDDKDKGKSEDAPGKSYDEDKDTGKPDNAGNGNNGNGNGDDKDKDKGKGKDK